MIRVAVLIPVLNRPDRVAPLVESLRESVAGSMSLEVTAAFICSPDDRKEQQAVEKAGLTPLIYKEPAGPGDYAKKINWAAAIHKNTEWLFLGADDLTFERGWLEAGLIEHFRSNACVVGTNDAANARTADGRSSTHTLVHRAYLECGTIDGKGLLHEGYDHNFCDDEFVGTAKHRDTYSHATAAIVRHAHPTFRTAKMDSTYEKALAHFDDDRRLFGQRAPLWTKTRVA